MATTIVNIKTDPQVKQKAQQIAADLGLTLSGVVNGFLRQFIRTKTVHFDLEQQPTDYLLSALEESKKERKKGQYYKFKNNKDALAFLNEQ